MRPSVTEPEGSTVNHSATEAAPSAASQLFDLRSVIALLFVVYGIILMIMGLFCETPGRARQGRRDRHQPLDRPRACWSSPSCSTLWAFMRPPIPPDRITYRYRSGRRTGHDSPRRPEVAAP